MRKSRFLSRPEWLMIVEAHGFHLLSLYDPLLIALVWLPIIDVSTQSLSRTPTLYQTYYNYLIGYATVRYSLL
jgi:hypothetical protein